MQTLSVLTHVCGVACFGVVFYWILFIVGIPAAKIFPGRWMYLSLWDVVLQLLYHSVGLINDIWGTSETISNRRSKLQRFRDWLFASWACPVGMFVSVSYWTLIALDPSLVLDVEKDSLTYFPMWLDQLEHTGPVIFLMLELATVPKFQPDWVIGVSTNLGFSITYLCWITWVHSSNGVWAYPMLEKMNFGAHILFNFAACLTMIVFYGLGVVLARCRLVYSTVQRNLDYI